MIPICFFFVFDYFVSPSPLVTFVFYFTSTFYYSSFSFLNIFSVNLSSRLVYCLVSIATESRSRCAPGRTCHRHQTLLVDCLKPCESCLIPPHSLTSSRSMIRNHPYRLLPHHRRLHPLHVPINWPSLVIRFIRLMSMKTMRLSNQRILLKANESHLPMNLSSAFLKLENGS